MAAMEAAMEDVEFVDFNQDDDAMDEDALADSRAGRRAARARAFSVPRVLSGATASAARILGRVRSGVLGHSPSVVATAPEGFGSLSDATDAGGLGHGPQRSIEGWIILVTGVEEDAEEDDLYNAFSEFGHVNNLHFNLESCTGYAKGYALIEYESFEEAQTAIKALNGRQLLTKTVYVDWAVSKSPPKQLSHMRSSRSRSRTPPRGLAALTTF